MRPTAPEEEDDLAAEEENKLINEVSVSVQEALKLSPIF